VVYGGGAAAGPGLWLINGALIVRGWRAARPKGGGGCWAGPGPRCSRDKTTDTGLGASPGGQNPCRTAAGGPPLRKAGRRSGRLANAAGPGAGPQPQTAAPGPGARTRRAPACARTGPPARATLTLITANRRNSSPVRHPGIVAMSPARASPAMVGQQGGWPPRGAASEDLSALSPNGRGAQRWRVPGQGAAARTVDDERLVTA
jgi:hypothetical protein